MNRTGATRGGLVVVIAAVATLALAWFVLYPRLERGEPPLASAPTEPTREAPAPEVMAEPAPPSAPSGDSVVIWQARDGSLHVGDDPPPESQELGKVTAHDARALDAARNTGVEGTSGGVRVEELMRRIRDDTARRPMADAEGDPTWSVRDIEGVVASDESLDVATDWITNATMIRVAKRLCRYVSAQSDVFEPSTVVVRGRGGRILARCKAVG